MTAEVLKTHGTDHCAGGRPCDSLWEYEYDYCGECLDLTCCCDICDHHMLRACDESFCCKCVPKAVIARFIPDNETLHCRVATVFLPATIGDVGPVTYSGGVPGLGPTTITVGCRPEDIYYESYAEGRTEWRLQTDEDEYGNPQYDEAWPIDHTPGASCRDLPDGFPSFAVEHKPATACNPACTGTVIFQAYKPFKVPFRGTPTGPTEVSLQESCGACQSTCSVICVSRLLAGQAESERERHLFRWDDASQTWKGGRSVYEYCEEEEIGLVTDEYGNCQFEILSWDESAGVFLGDRIAVPDGECTQFSVEAQDELGNEIRITCSNCGCWSFLCGECRCVCSNLCMIGGNEDNLAITPSALEWDDDLGGWIGGEYGDEFIQVLAVEGSNCLTKECGIEVDGFDDPEVTFSDTSSICSRFVSFTITEENEYGFKWRTVWCSRGANCGGEGSCVQCEDVPQIVFADVSPEEWDVSVLGCPGNNSGITECFEPFTIELQIARNHNQDASADTFWYGARTFSCRSCSGTIDDYAMTLLLQCTGELLMQIIRLSDGEVIYSQEKTVDAPCADCIYPYESSATFDTSAAGTDCCDETQINVDLSE